jgi:predicted nucleotidyltransferase component of viral defense system
MDKNSIYFRQVQLLVRILPFVAKEKCFALKGGTAINLFVRDLPRLSVDIDLVYLPLEDRKTSLRNVSIALERIIQEIKASLPNIHADRPNQAPDGLRLVIAQQGVQIKVELSPVLRGSVFPPEEREVSEQVENLFGYVSMLVMSFPDVYAGKICAALDRQHPRDLFDIKLLLENEGIDEPLRKTFLAYLISHPRPIAELLSPRRKEIQAVYKTEFASMSETPVLVSELEGTREQLISTLHSGLTDKEKEFLLSFKRRSPQWDLLGLEGIQELPAIKWKLINLAKMSSDKHTQALNSLEKVLDSLK